MPVQDVLQLRITLTNRSLPASLYDELLSIKSDRQRADRLRSLIATGYVAERLIVSGGVAGGISPAPLPRPPTDKYPAENKGRRKRRQNGEKGAVVENLPPAALQVTHPALEEDEIGALFGGGFIS